MLLMICRFGTITDSIELHGKDLKIIIIITITRECKNVIVPGN